MVQNNTSVNRAAQNFGVPITTLKDRVCGQVDIAVSSSGLAPLFSRSEEGELVEHVKYMATIGYGYSRLDLRHTATDLATSLNKRTSKELLTDHWVHNFLKRWPDLKLNKLRSLEWVRAKSATK